VVFKDTATTEIYTLPLHDALPISEWRSSPCLRRFWRMPWLRPSVLYERRHRSEEHTSELQSHLKLVCPLLPETQSVALRARYRPTRAAALRSRPRTAPRG